MAIYIGGIINSRPSDQTDLNKWCRAILKVVENRHSKGTLICGSHRPTGLQVGPAGPPVSILA